MLNTGPGEKTAEFVLLLQTSCEVLSRAAEPYPPSYCVVLPISKIKIKLLVLAIWMAIWLPERILLTVCAGCAEQNSPLLLSVDQLQGTAATSLSKQLQKGLTVK